MNARELRVWHWRMACSARLDAYTYEHVAKAQAKLQHWSAQSQYAKSARTAYEAHATADWHFAAVQVLDEHPDCVGTTAEYDVADHS